MSTLRWWILGVGAVVLLLIYYFDRHRHGVKGRDIFADRNDPETDVLLDESVDKGLEQQFNIPSQTAFKDLETQELDALAEELSGRIEPDLPERYDIEDDESLDDQPDGPLSADELLAEDDVTQALDGELDDEPKDVEPAVDTQAEAEADSSEVVVMYVVAQDGKPFRGQAVLKAFHAHKLRFGELDVFHRIHGVGAEAKTIFSISDMLNPGTLIPEDLVHAEVKGLSLFMKLPGPADISAAYDDMLHCAKHIAATLDGMVKDETMVEMTQDKISEQRQHLKRAFA